MHEGGLYIRSCRWPHHEAPECRFIESHATVCCVHIRHDLMRIQKNNEVLRKKTQSIDDEVFLRQPDGTTLRHTELRANDPHIDVGELVWVVNLTHPARAGDLWYRGANHLCPRMKSVQNGLAFRHTANIVSGSSGFLKMYFKLLFEGGVCALKDRDLRRPCLLL